MSFTLVNAQTVVARNAGALYGLAVGAANMAQYSSQIGSNTNGFLNTVYTNSVGETGTDVVADTLIANLGITGEVAVEEAKTYIVGKLNAVDYTARGAVINTMLARFSNLTDDAMFGTFAEAWNAKVSNAIAYGASIGTGDANFSDATTSTIGMPFTLTVESDAINGTAGNDTITATAAVVFDSTASAKFVDVIQTVDVIDGGAGIDTLNIRPASAFDTTSAALAGLSLTNVEKVNIDSAFAVKAVSLLWTGLTDLGVKTTASAVDVTAATTTNITSSTAAAAGMTTAVNGGANVSVTTTGANASTATIAVGAVLAPVGTVKVVENLAALDGGVTTGKIDVTGGTSVNVTTVAVQGTKVGVSATPIDATNGAVTVTGTALTTNAVVNQGIATGVKEVFTLKIPAAGTKNDELKFDTLTSYKSAGGLTAITEAAAFAAAYNLSTSPNWVASASDDTITFTAKKTGAVTDAASTDFTGTATTLKITAAEVATTTQGLAGVVAGAVTINDVNAASTVLPGSITSVSLTNFGAAKATSNALAFVTLAGAGTSYTGSSGVLTKATATTQTLTLAGVTTTGAVDVGTVPTTLNIAAVSAANTVDTLTASKATAVNISGNQALTVSKAFTFDAKAAIVSTSTAAVTIKADLGATQSYVGGAGADTIQLATTSTVAISTGAGNDVVTIAGLAGKGGSVNAGADTDTLVAAYATLSTATATDTANYIGFEAIQANTAATGTVDATIWGVNSVILDKGLAAGAKVIANTGATVTLNGTASANITTVEMKADSKADSATVVLNLGWTDDNNTKAAPVGTTTAITATGIETLTVQSSGKSSVAVADQVSGFVPDTNVNTLTLVNNDLKSLIVTGGDSIVFASAATQTGLGLVDASANFGAFTKIDVSLAVDNTTSPVVPTAPITIKGSSLGNTLIGSANADVIIGGGGVDTITGGKAGDTLSGGAGNDTFVYAAGHSSIGTGTFDTITDFVANTKGNGVSPILDLAATPTATDLTGDVLGFTHTGTAVAANGFKVFVASNAADATTFLANTASASNTQASAALDSTSNKLYVDVSGDGVTDFYIHLTGVTTITAAAFTLA